MSDAELLRIEAMYAAVPDRVDHGVFFQQADLIREIPNLIAEIRELRKSIVPIASMSEFEKAKELDKAVSLCEKAFKDKERKK